MVNLSDFSFQNVVKGYKQEIYRLFINALEFDGNAITIHL